MVLALVMLVPSRERRRPIRYLLQLLLVLRR